MQDNELIPNLIGIAKVHRLIKEARLPERADPDSVGYDLYAAEAAHVRYEQVTLIRTGLIIQPPPGYFISIRGRSGLGKKLVTIPQSVGTIDPSFAGPGDEILVMLTLIAETAPLHIKLGDRIAQIVFEKVNSVAFVESLFPPLNKTRGGFGSSGTNEIKKAS